jgi:hypothetical protein
MIVHDYQIKTVDGTIVIANLGNSIRDFLVAEVESKVTYVGHVYFKCYGLLFQVEIWDVDGNTVMANMKRANQ